MSATLQNRDRHGGFLTSDRQLPPQMRLAETRKPVLYNGALECRFFRFELVGGRYRPRAPAPA